MRGLGWRRVGAWRLRYAVGTGVAVVLLAAGCGGDGGPSGDGGASSPAQGESSATAPSSPSAEPTPAVLEGGTAVEGPGFAFTVAPGYDKSDNSGKLATASWYRQYSVDALTSLEVVYDSGTRDSYTSDLMKSYFTGAGADRSRRREDVPVMGKAATHWTARNRFVQFDTYIVNVGDGHSVKIDFQRPADSRGRDRLQQLMLDSFRLTG